ncbi:MAG TPA: HAD-IC family P-type ATPase, partial [Armatimonadota bacterium]|nr:HAD-IC family P-type ATPase [Armatimonadota bacterium]
MPEALMQAKPLRLEVTHIIPGRIRIHVHGVLMPPDALLTSLNAVPHVREVKYDSFTHSLVILHDPGLTVDDLQHVCCDEVPAEVMTASFTTDKEQTSSANQEEQQPTVPCVIHTGVPGRIRLHLPLLQRQPAIAHHLSCQLKYRNGILTARANVVTGNLLVEFSPSKFTQAEICQLVTELAAMPVPTSDKPTHPTDHSTRELYRWAASEALPQVLQKMDVVSTDGLSDDDVRRRMMALGSRALDVEFQRKPAEIIKDQFLSVPTLILGGAALLSACTGACIDAIVISSVILLNGVIGYFTERYAESAVEALCKLGYPQAHVIREGKRQIVPAANLVPGDIIRLHAGDLVPADARIIKGSLLVDEAMITGESEPVHKTADSTDPPQHIYQFGNIAFHGTAVVDGRAHALVLTTGKDTELGRINMLVNNADSHRRTRMQDELDRLGKTLGIGGVAVCSALVGGRLLRRTPTMQTMKTGISQAVSAVPEGLPTVAVTALAQGMQRMLDQQVIIRKLPAVEALGSVTVLCVDKTGTLTLNQMAVERYWWEGNEYRYHTQSTVHNGYFSLNNAEINLHDHPLLQTMLHLGVLCNEAKLRPDAGDGLHVSGSATEGALLLAAHGIGHKYQAIRKAHPLLAMHRRGKHQPWMASFHSRQEGGVLISVKGAPDAVLALCSARMDELGNIVPLTDADRLRYRVANERMAEEGLRVLAFARVHREQFDANEALDGLTWVGLVGIHDPIRPGVADAIRRCRQAGVRVVVLTGDQRGTAQAVASHLGLASDDTTIINASDLAQLSSQEIDHTVQQATVFARVSPEDKLRIVQSLQAAGEVVVMTGDGINDGPALKAADIGVAMGERSSDVAKELADVVLTRNDFTALVAAIEQGRTIFTNIQRALRYLMVANISEMCFSAATLLFGLPFPLHPVQILWLNLISDVFPALALVMEPIDRRVMHQPPRRPDALLIQRSDWRNMSIDTITIMGSLLGVYLWGLKRYGIGRHASAVTFTAATLSEALYLLACRGQSPKTDTGYRRQALAFGSIGLTIGLHLAINHWAPLRRLLYGSPLSMLDY